MSYTQRETPILAELCTFLVEDIYGELAARVYSILARHGRQTLAALARASYLNGRQIKYGLTILLQQHLAYHSGSDTPPTYYEIDWPNSYALVRVGKVTRLVEDRFGKKAANVVSNLLTLGHTKISDLKEAYFPSKSDSDDESDSGIVNGSGLKRKRTNGAHINGTTDTEKMEGLVNGNGNSTNGIGANGEAHDELDDDEITSPDELDEIIEKLMQAGWVRTVQDTQYLSPGDMHDMLYQDAIELANGGMVPTGTKDKDNVARALLALKRETRDGWAKVPNFPKKRGPQASEYGSTNKRVKLNGDNSWSAASLSNTDKIVIRVNPEKIAVAMRTEQLVHLVQQRLGDTTAHIYQIMLRLLEPRVPRCFEEFPDPPLPNADLNGEDTRELPPLVTAREVTRSLDKDFDMCEGLDPQVIVETTRKGHVVRGKNKLEPPVDPSKLSLDEKTLLVDKHIQLLAHDPFHFVTWHSRAGHSQWHVEFDEIAKQMIQTEIENTVSARKGMMGVKLIRALRKKGKLDERGTCNVMMMSANDIRGIVNDLTVYGFVQTQEIPKVERREAKHSIHLIWYDRQRAREKLLHDTYKGMVRILQRIAFEREKVQPLLSKAERSDVVGNEEKWLSKGELDALKKWKEVQEKLLLQLFREDDLIATLRDFHGPLITI